MGFPRAWIALSSIFALGLVAAPAQGRGWLRDVDHAMSVAEAEQRPMVLFVSMDGCVHCYRMIETTFRDAAVRQTLGTSFVAAAIKGSERPDLMRHLKIRSYPTTLLVSPSGEVMDQMVGYTDAQKFQERLIKATSQGHRDRVTRRRTAAPVSTRLAETRSAARR